MGLAQRRVEVARLLEIREQRAQTARTAEPREIEHGRRREGVCRLGPRRTAAETLAQKAVAVGIRGEQVDGNDVIAVREACERALARARDGQGPSLIEAVTYRLGDHTTADDASRYREDQEVSRHWAQEPILRLRQHLVARGAWSTEQEERLLADCGAAVEAAAEKYLATPPEPPEAMFDQLYAVLPASLTAQREAAIAVAKERQAGHG